MFVKTRIPKDTNCVRFCDHQVAGAYQLANLFLQWRNGRLANALDLMEARVKYGFNHPIWKYFITTASTEWLGLNQEGQLIIVVLHNPGPLANEDLLLKTYGNKSRDQQKFNIISRQMFLDVADGKYGEISSISLAEAISRDNAYNDLSELNELSIKNDKLLQTRLGNSFIGYKYTQKCLNGQLEEFSEKSKIVLECNCDQYFPTFIGYEQQEKFIQTVEKSSIDLETEAIGHFISFGGLMNTGKNKTTTNIKPAAPDYSFAFLAITNENESIRLDKKLCTYNLGDYREKLSQLFVPSDKVSSDTLYLNNFYHNLFFEIKKIKGWYFTQRYRNQVSVNDQPGEPEFLVKDLKPLGRRTIKFSTSKGCHTQKYIRKLFANPEANAFAFISELKNDGKKHLAVVEYYKAEFYFDRAIPKETEVIKNYEWLGRII